MAERRPAAAARQDEVLRQRAVARAQSLASGVVKKETGQMSALTVLGRRDILNQVNRDR